MKKLESRVGSMRNAGQTWKDIEKVLDQEGLLQGNGSNSELFVDLKAMDGKSLKKIPREELYALIAEMLLDNPTMKPMELRDNIWRRGVYFYRREFRAFDAQLKRRGLSLGQYIEQEKGKQIPPPHEDDLFSITDFRILSGLVSRYGKDKVVRVLRDAM